MSLFFSIELDQAIQDVGNMACREEDTRMDQAPASPHSRDWPIWVGAWELCDLHESTRCWVLAEV